MLQMVYFHLSYVDDFPLIVTSTSYEQNSRKLIAAFDSLAAQGTSIRVPFAPEKIEVINWETYRDRSPAPFSPIQLGGQSITPSTSACWLGFWLDQRRTSAVYFQKRAASAATTPHPLIVPPPRMPATQFLPNDQVMGTHTHLGLPPAPYRQHSFAPETMVQTNFPNARPCETSPPAQPPLTTNQGRLQTGPGLSPPPV